MSVRVGAMAEGMVSETCILSLLMETLSFISAHQLSIFEALEHFCVFLLDFGGITRTEFEPSYSLKMYFRFLLIPSYFLLTCHLSIRFV